MISTGCSTKIPNDLREASRIRAEFLGYPSWNAYIVGLIRRDLVEAGAHELPQKIARMGGLQRDQIDASILDRCRREMKPADFVVFAELVPLARQEAAA